MMRQQQTIDKQQQIIDYLADHPVFASYVHDASVIDPLTWPYVPRPALPSVEELVEMLAEDAGFQALKLGSWLGTTDGQIISEAVGFAIPPQYGAAYQLAVEGLMLAAKLQQKQGRETAAAIAVVIVFGALLVAGGDAP
jgi:hypothetical protein